MIAVTGASGHLGQWVVARLTDLGHDVLCVSRRPLDSPGIEGLRWKRPVRVLACDLADPASVGSIRADLREVDAVAHLAARVTDDTGRNLREDAEATLESNVLATVHLLAALGDARHLRSVVYASTFEVYGPPIGSPVTEDHPTDPVTHYGAGKLAGEKYVSLFGGDRGVACCALRMPAIYGPGDRLRRAIGNFIRSAAAGESLTIHGDGSDRRDLLYAADAAEAVALSLQRRAGGVMNLGSGEGYSVLDIAESVRDVAGGEIPVIHRERVKPRRDYVLSIERARSELGWSPRTPLKEGIRAQLDWVISGGK